MVGLQQRAITSQSSLNDLLKDVLNERKKLSAKLNDHEIRKRSVLIFTFNLYEMVDSELKLFS